MKLQRQKKACVKLVHLKINRMLHTWKDSVGTENIQLYTEVGETAFVINIITLLEVITLLLKVGDVDVGFLH